MVMKFIYLGQCEVGQNELDDFLATGNDLKVAGIMEDVYLIEEPVVDNGTHYKKEHQEPDLKYTDLDGKTWEMSNQKNESEITIAANQQEGGRSVCSECNPGFGSNTDILHHKRSKHAGIRYECDKCDHR